ncbi:MAG: hypothetical protein AVDCRST_MAG16-2663 [uncultured Frankineae bacterium]|uniref:Uncharacterized protein n=1 Tax=uncultured Frankineae bacterium TaxID=437475 RepID=A0A6J4MFF6_9ACTN|nr:MAG: hypothetical protein AVDCRST_MAG16-2663 [uncultured Frankineae bacterium]
MAAGRRRQTAALSRTTTPTARKVASVPSRRTADGRAMLPSMPPSAIASDIADTAVARWAAVTRLCRIVDSSGQVAPWAT